MLDSKAGEIEENSSDSKFTMFNSQPTFLVKFGLIKCSLIVVLIIRLYIFKDVTPPSGGIVTLETGHSSKDTLVSNFMIQDKATL
jgi:hypothetical protein